MRCGTTLAAGFAATLAGLALAGCAPTTADRGDATRAPTVPALRLHETPPPADGWRGHRLARCPREAPAPPRIESLLALGAEWYGDGSGSDAMIELEMALAEGHRHPLLLFVLGFFYLMAGQGDPSLLPSEGPAADTGDWATNRPRLLRRAQALLEEAAGTLDDDAAVDYLLADVALAAGREVEAEARMIRGWDKCTGGRTFEIVRTYRQLNRYPARVREAGSPAYPSSALDRGVQGTVTLDLLLDPAGEVRQVVAVASPDAALTAAAAEVFRAASYAPARIGKYPVWAWLRVSTAFTLGGHGGKAG